MLAASFVLGQFQNSKFTPRFFDASYQPHIYIKNDSLMDHCDWFIYDCSSCEVVEILENLAYLANASNLVLYLREYMHMSPSKSANDVTNFMGTAFLLALLGGFLSDAFFSTFQIFLISASIEFLVNLS